MPRAFLIEQSIIGDGGSEQNSDIARSTMSKLMSARRGSVQKMTEAIEVVSEKLQRAADELAVEREMRSEAELTAQHLAAQLGDLQKKYADLHQGLVRVLTEKFPDEHDLSIETRLDALLLASNIGAEIGSQPKISSTTSSNFLNLIEEAL